MLSLYLDPSSAPDRALHMAVALLRLEHEYEEVDTAWTGPVLAEDSLAISEPLAALTYMASQHRPGQLYPICAKVRSQVDQRLYFYLGTLHPRVEDCLLPVGSTQAAAIQEEKVATLKEALLWANQMVVNGFVCGSSLTIADLVFLATFATLEACDVVPLGPYKNLARWAQNMQGKIPNYQENNVRGAESFAARLRESHQTKTEQEEGLHIQLEERHGIELEEGLEIEQVVGLEIELEERLEQEDGIVQELEDTLELKLDENLNQSLSSCSGTLEKRTSSCSSILEKTDLTHEMMSIEMYRNHEEDLELSRRTQMQEFLKQQETNQERRDQLETRRRQEDQVHLRGGTVSQLVKAFAALHQPLVSCSAEV